MTLKSSKARAKCDEYDDRIYIVDPDACNQIVVKASGGKDSLSMYIKAFNLATYER
jgi:hypothetical protein